MTNFFLLSIIAYFFSPSFYIIEGFPIRYSDIILIIGCIPIIYLLVENKEDVRIDSTFIIYILFICIMLISYINNYKEANILYPLKMLSYLYFYFAGQILYLKRFTIKKLVIFFIITSLLTLILYPFEYKSIWSTVDRITLTFVGPYNVGLVFAMIYFLDRSIYTKSLSLVFVFLSGSRTMLISVIFYSMLLGLKNRPKLIIPILLVLPICLLAASKIFDSNRLTNGIGKIPNTFLYALEQSNLRNPVNSNIEYENLFHSRADAIVYEKDGANIDFSLYLRFVTWNDVIKNNLQNTTFTLIGYGPGFYSSSTDGSFIRLFGETGLVGLLVYLIFLLSTYQNLLKLEMQGVLYMFLASGIMIDTFYSSIAVPLLLIIVGYIIHKVRTDA